MTLAACGVSTAYRGTESEVVHKWVGWLHYPYRRRGPHRLRPENRIRLRTSGQGGYITSAASGLPTASQLRAEPEAAHKWANRLHNPCRRRGRHRFREGNRITGGP